MKAEYRKIIRRSAFLVGMLAVCAVGIHTAVARTEANAPDALTAAVQQNPVIVLDAGHGESTKT